MFFYCNHTSRSCQLKMLICFMVSEYWEMNADFSPQRISIGKLTDRKHWARTYYIVIKEFLHGSFMVHEVVKSVVVGSASRLLYC